MTSAGRFRGRDAPAARPSCGGGDYKIIIYICINIYAVPRDFYTPFAAVTPLPCACDDRRHRGDMCVMRVRAHVFACAFFTLSLSVAPQKSKIEFPTYTTKTHILCIIYILYVVYIVSNAYDAAAMTP